jgi:hypothetical protein
MERVINLLFIKSLFVPNNEYIDLNITSTNTFIKYLEKYKSIAATANIYVRVVGWINNKTVTDKNNKKLISFFTNVQESTKQCGIDFDYNVWDKNYGKIKLLSSIKNKYPFYSDVEYIMYADHDISLTPIISSTLATPSSDDNNINIITEAKIIGHTIDDKQIQIVSFDQWPDNRHNHIVYTKKIIFDRSTYFFSPNNVHIASGCFMASSKIISQLAELQTDNLYGDEDILLGNMLNNTNCLHVVSQKKVHHPFDIDPNYVNWKRNNIFRIVLRQNNKNNNKILHYFE